MLLKISQNPQENTCARASFLVILQATPATLLKKRFWHRCFLVKFAKFLRTPILQNNSGRLLLKRRLTDQLGVRIHVCMALAKNWSSSQIYFYKHNVITLTCWTWKKKNIIFWKTFHWNKLSAWNYNTNRNNI